MQTSIKFYSLFYVIYEMIILLIYENIIAYVLNNIIQLIVFTAFLLKSHITFHKNELQFNIYIWTLYLPPETYSFRDICTLS